MTPNRPAARRQAPEVTKETGSMAYQCWKCKAGLPSPGEPFCPKCGIVSPVDGKRNYELLRHRLHRACTDAPRFATVSTTGCLCAGGLTFMGLLVAFMAADSLEAGWLDTPIGTLSADAFCVLLGL